MNGIIFDTFISPQPAGQSGSGKESVSFSSGGSFDRMVKKQMTEGPEANRLGVKSRDRQGLDKRIGSDREDKEKAQESQPTVAAMLERLMDMLKEIALQEKSGPGEWVAFADDYGAIQDICAAAGMGSNEISVLLQQMEGSEGKIDLAKFFDFFARHFEELRNETPVTAPEPDLTLLELFLTRMGVPVEQVQSIADNSVTGDGRFDLSLFLNGLSELEQTPGIVNLNSQQENSAELRARLQQISLSRGKDNPVILETISLTAWEKEQLQNLLSRAGISEESLGSIFPEGEENFNLSFSALKDIMARGVSAIQAERPQFDLPSFLSHLDQLFMQSGFFGKSAGWSPVVQESIESIYQELLATVDMSTVKIEVGPQKNHILGGEAGAGKGRDSESLTNPLEADFVIEEDQETLAGRRNIAAGGKSENQGDPKSGKEGINELKPFSSFALSSESGGVTAQIAEEPVAEHQPRMYSETQQKVMEQLMQGVARGVRNNEHHLILRLYPQDLGEVKVNLVVHDEKVSISFAMENSKVKDILEGNMSQFRDSMAQRGFEIQDCMVSLEQHENGGTYRGFEQTSTNSFRQARARIAGSKEQALYRWFSAQDMEKRTINVTV